MRKRLSYRVVSTLFLLGFPGSAIAQTPVSKQLILDAKPSVVRIEVGCRGTYRYNSKPYSFSSGSSGSGFFINSNGYIVTNAHVVSDVVVPDRKDKCRERLFADLIREVANDEPENVAQSVQTRIRDNSVLESFRYFQNVILFSEPGGEKFERFEFDLKKMGKPIGETQQGEGGNKDVAVIKIEVKDTPALLLSEPSETIQYQEKVTVIGYPGVADLQASLSEASVMENTVANPNKKLPDKTPVIQLNQTVPRGSSGGPVLDDQGKVIGIATFDFRVEGDKVAFAVPASVIREFLGPAGATNQTGTIDDLYQQGLQLYSRGEYEGAKLKFEAVKGLFKYHSEIDRLIRDCNQKIAERAVSPQYLFWGAIGGFTALILGIAYLLFRQKPTRQVAGFPAGMSFPDVSSGKRDRSRWGSKSKAASGLFRPTVVSAQHKINLQNVQGKELNLSLTQPEYRLGRDVSWSNFKFPSEGWGVISRKQAFFRKNGDAYYLFDGDGKGTASTNRIYLGESPIPPTGLELKHGMRLKIGNDPSNRVILTYFSSNENQDDDRTDISHK